MATNGDFRIDFHYINQTGENVQQELIVCPELFAPQTSRHKDKTRTDFLSTHFSVVEPKQLVTPMTFQGVKKKTLTQLTIQMFYISFKNK